MRKVPKPVLAARIGSCNEACRTSSSSPMVSTGEFMATNGIVRVGWIGTGIMGLPMCRNLQNAGFPITLFNRTPSKAQLLCDEGATLVQSPMIVAQHSDVVFTMLGNASDVRDVILGSEGVLAGLRPGCALVDTTSSEPALAREIFAVAEAHGVEALDAPVSGGEIGARDGTLAIMAGGKEQTVGRLQSLFECLGSVTYVGPAGAGQSCKLANQICVAANLVGLAEGMLYARRVGIDSDQFLKALSGGAAGSKAMELYGPRIVKEDYEPGGFAEYMVKDLGTALRESQAMGASLPGMALSQQQYISLVAHGNGRLGIHAVPLSLQRFNNVAIPEEK